MNEHCRLCSTQWNPLISIFGETGVKHQLKEKINRRLQILVSENDFLSKSICCNCCGKLDIFDQFVNDVHKTQINLQKRTIDILKQPTSRFKNEKIVNSVEISEYDESITSANRQIYEVNNQVSVIKSHKLQFVDNNDRTRMLTNSSTNLKEITYNDETKTIYSQPNGQLNKSREFFTESKNKLDLTDENDCTYIEDSEDEKDSVENEGSAKFSQVQNFIPGYYDVTPKNQIVPRVKVKAVKRLGADLKFSAKRRSTELSADRRILRSNTKYHFFKRSISENNSPANNCSNFSDGKPIEYKISESKERKKSTTPIDTADFSVQTGNTLLSDLKCLKNSLLLRKVDTRNASVLTIPVPCLPNATSAGKSSIDTANSKGCQTEILLGAKSESKMVYQKISFQGRSFLEIGSENNAMIISKLPV